MKNRFRSLVPILLIQYWLIFVSLPADDTRFAIEFPFSTAIYLIYRPTSYNASFEVGASTTYEPTGSFKNTSFLVEAGTNYTASLLEGGDLTAGLVTGQIYPIALKKVVNGAGTVIKLLK